MKDNKNQAVSLQFILMQRTKQILGCFSKPCKEAVRGDMGSDIL